MTQGSTSSVGTARRGAPRSGRRTSRLLWLMLILGIPAALVIGGLSWWEDRPLREIAAELEREDYANSLRLADKFLTTHPEDSRARILRARALSALGRHIAADLQFQQVAQQYNGFPDDPDAMRAWSVSLLHQEQWSRAIAVMETLLETFPNDAEILYRLTVSRIRLSQFEAALSSAKRLAMLPDYEQQAKVIIGTIHHDKGNPRAALEVWESVLAVNPDATGLQISPEEFLAMIGEDLLECGAPERAIVTLERCAASDPTARTYALLGSAYLQTGREEDAVSAWKKALQHDALNASAAEELANIALRKGEPQQAVDLMLPLAQTPELNSSSAYILQRSYAQLKQTDESDHWRDRTNELRDKEKTRSTIKDLLRNSTDSFWSAFLRAYQLADEQRWGDAERIVQDLLLQRPDDTRLHRLAAAIRQRGNLPSLNDLTENNP